VLQATKTDLYLYRGIEFALVKVPGWGYYFEGEIATDRRSVAKANKKIISACRGVGMGKYLMAEVIKLAKRELKPKPEIIRLSVFSNNKPAISLYRKIGFKEVGRIPKQIQYQGKLVDEIIMLLDLRQ